MTNVEVPESAIDEQYRDQMRATYFMEGVHQLLRVIQDSHEGAVYLTVPPETRSLIKDRSIREDFVIGSLRKMVPCSFLEGILDTVRTRVLNLTLELESKAADAGNPLEDLRKNKPEQIQHIYNTEIRGTVGNFAQGSSDFSQVSHVQANDQDALAKVLNELGLDEQSVVELVAAAKEERPINDKAFGPRVSQLVGKAVGKAWEGLLKVPGTVAANLLASALKGYYGL